MIQWLREHYTDKGGYKDILSIAIPLMGSMLSITFMEFTDKLLLGHYSILAVAAVGPASISHLLFLVTFNNIIGFAGIVIAQYIGANSNKTVGIVLWQSVWIALVCSAILFGLAFISESLFTITKQPLELIPLEKEYFDTLCIFSIVPLMNNVLIAFYSGKGKTVRVSVAIITAGIINIPLNYILINGMFGIPQMGIRGAAIATIVAWFVELCILFMGVCNKEDTTTFALLQGFQFDAPLLKRILIYGIPSGLYSFLELLGATIFLFLVGVLGHIEIAIINITFSLDLFGYLPIMGLSIALSIVTGRSIGEHNTPVIRRAFTHSMQLMALWRSVLGFLFLIIPYMLFQLIISPSDAADVQTILSYAPSMLAICVFNGFIDGIMLMLIAVLKGYSKTMYSMVTMFLCVLFAEAIPMMLLLYYQRATMYTLWACYIGYKIVAIFLFYAKFRRLIV